MAKMSDFSNHNIFAYMLASCANLNFHPVPHLATQRRSKRKIERKDKAQKVILSSLILGRIWKVAGASFAGAVIPIPGLSIMVDLNFLKNEVDLYKSQLGLPEEKSEDFRRMMTPELFEKCRNSTVQIVQLMTAYGVSSAVEEVARYIPILGSAIAGSISYSSTYYFLQRYLNELESTALQFLDEVNTRADEDLHID